MSADIRNQLRALFESELPAVFDRAAGSGDPDGLAVDGLVLAIFSALLKDPSQHLAVLARDAQGQRVWLLDRVDEARAIAADSVAPGASDEPDEPGDCVRPAATDWVDEYFAGRLAPSSEPGLRSHLDDCPACRARYCVLRTEEGARDDGLARRIKRLARGLPWSEVPDPEVADESGDESAADADADAADDADDDVDADDAAAADDDEQGPKRFWLTPRGRWIVYGISVGLALLGIVLLLFAAPARNAHLQEETPRTRVIKPLPDQGLAVALLRYQPNSRHDTPWRSVQSAVASGDRLLVTYSLDEGKKQERGRPRYLTIVGVDDKGRFHWLRPSVAKPAQRTSPPVAVPVLAARLPRELRAPSGIERLVIYAVLTDRPIRLTTIESALSQAVRRPDFATSPPILNIDRSGQHHLVLDVLR